jgi:hypothetical protein
MSSATTFTLVDLIKLHRGFVGRGEYQRIGRLVKIVLAELPKGVDIGIPAIEIEKEGRTLDWFEKGPMLGLSPGGVDLLITSPIPELPKKPKPGFVPPMATQEEIERQVRETGKFTPATAPLVDQRPEDRGCTRVKGTTLLSFEPVHEVLFRAIGPIPTWGHAIGQTVGETKPAFLWDYVSNEGFFYGGSFRLA